MNNEQTKTDNLKTRIAEALIQAWGKQTYGTPNQIAVASAQAVLDIVQPLIPKRQTMETAPKDGSYILVFGRQFDGGCAVTKWGTTEGYLNITGWLMDDGKDFEIVVRVPDRLTHWQPLPTAPAEE